MNSKSVYFGILSNVLGNLLMLGATLLLTRMLTANQFGQFRVGSNFATLMIPFLALGGERLISRLIQSSSNDKTQVSKALATVLFLVACGTLLLAILYPLISRHILDDNVSAGVYFLSIAIIPSTIIYNLANTIWRHNGSAAAAQVHLNFTQRVLRAPLLVGMSFIWPTALSASIAMTTAQFLSLAQIRKNLLTFSFRGLGSFQTMLRTNLKELLVIGFPVAIMATVDRLDVLLVNAFMDVERAGTYDLIYMLSLTAMFPAMALSKSTEPFLFGLAGDVGRLDKLKQLQTKTFLASCTAVIGVAVAAPILSQYLGNAGPDFADAALILAAGLAFSSAHGPVIEYLQINGKTKLVLSAVVGLLLVFLGLKYLAASIGSLTGVAALAGLFYFTLRMVLSLYIYFTDKIIMSRPPIILLSCIGYTAVAAYVWRLGH